MEPLHRYKALYGEQDLDTIPFRPRPDDIIISGHAKSGTTWMRQIVHQIRTGGDDTFENIVDVTTFLPLTKTAYEGPNALTNLDDEQVAKPRIFKAHALYEMLQMVEGQTRFIVPIRNPYDTEYSFTKFLWRLLGYDRDVSAAEYLQIVDMSLSHDFADFIASWFRHRNDPNVFIIPFEDLKRDLAACVQKIAVFVVGEPLAETTLSKVVHFSSFEYMSKNGEKFKPTGRNLPNDRQDQTEIKKPLVDLVRKDGGQVDQGKRLDESIKRHIDERWADVIEKEFGFKNYDELYKKCSVLSL